MADGAGGGGDAPLSKNAQKKLAAAKAREEAKAAKKSAREAAAKDTKSKKKEKGGAEKAEKKGADKASADKGGGEQFSFPKAEEEILSFWEDIKAFETSLKLSEGKKEFTFYDGPPFATGKPHYGHILAGTIKDVVCRYAHQTGHYVERKFGWDTHGLPVEYEIDKTHNITGPADVAAMGIAKYNELCRAIVMRYSNEWKVVVNRLGRWIDFEDDYKTLYPWFMESVWWVFSELFKKNLVYRGFRVMPFSTALATPLSNFEANQEFQDCKDPWCIVNFPVIGEENTYLLAWTTTPWTLPSNLALCVHPQMEYCRVKDVAKGDIYIVMKARVVGKGCLYSEKDKKGGKFEILSTCVGSELVGLKYTPLFDYFAPTHKDTAWRVISDDYVTDDSGVGVVHQAPAFGEDDYRVCLREKIIDVTNVPCPVDDSGRFTSAVSDYTGQYIKDADSGIIADLKKKGRLVQSGSLTHRDGFCWRSGTRLVRKAVDSWFVKVTDFIPDLLKSNDGTYWVPASVKEKRFRNWLENARDWNISRNRYWGTPIPLWVSDDYEEVVCISSIKELEELSGVTGITDLHRESIDDITIPSKKGKGQLRRIKQVFDCWFESGSMPYASRHYPFEQRARFDDTFPADFIAEGLDQTRGWFYTLTVLGTALFGKAPFKNLIVNGLVLAEDGSKMSKRKKNYPDPMDVIHQFGSDALRCYLMNSPVVHAQELNFNKKGIQAHLKDLFLPWLNALRFFEQSTTAYKEKTGTAFIFDDKDVCPSSNVTDRWLLAFAQDMITFFHKEMKAYRLYTVIPKLFGFVEQLTNWYIRFNRKRLMGDAGLDEAQLALWTLGEVLYTQSRIMAPFAPFFSEWTYLRLKKYIKSASATSGSVAADISKWDVSAVGDWLVSVSLASAKEEFVKNGMNGKDLLDLSHDDLISMGFSECHDRKSILREAEKLKSDNSEAPSEAVAAEYASIHFQMLPEPNASYYDQDIVRAFEVMKSIVNSGRIVRDRATMPIKYPLRELVIISKDQTILDDALSLQSYIEDELNIQMFTLTKQEEKYNIEVKASGNQRAYGKRLKGDAKKVTTAISQMSKPDIEAFQEEGKVTLCGHELTSDDILISYSVGSSSSESKFMANVDPQHPKLVVLLDCAPSEAMLMEGTAREICSNVQKLRKEAKLTPKDAVRVFFTTVEDSTQTKLASVLDKFALTKISEDLKAGVSLETATEPLIIEKTVDIGKDGAQLKIGIARV